ncbi:MAG: tetratricopeptide repeat protein [Termitinemataceae bacterium]|nr:MAG: tetratricopeptide repeat protein [Termitinemataceae bacterium]
MDNTSKIVFLPVPEKLHNLHFHTSSNEFFHIDPQIPIPIEIENSKSGDAASTTVAADLRLEMIVSAMLRVVGGENQRDVTKTQNDYYKKFIKAAKPNLCLEFSQAAIAKAKNGDYDSALEISRLLLCVFDNSPQVFLVNALVLEEKAEAAARNGNETEEDIYNEKTFCAYDAALNAEEILPDTFFNAGFFYMKMQNYAKALECFSTYMPLSEDEIKKTKTQDLINTIKNKHLDDLIFTEAYNLIKKGDEQKGMEKLYSFLEKNPSVWNAWFMLGWALRRQSRFNDGAAAFKKALELGGGTCDTHNELAICLMENGDLKGAQHELEAALMQESENVKIISNLAVLSLKQGNREKAAAFFRAAAEIDPEDPAANQFFAESSR